MVIKSLAKLTKICTHSNTKIKTPKWIRLFQCIYKHIKTWEIFPQELNFRPWPLHPKTQNQLILENFNTTFLRDSYGEHILFSSLLGVIFGIFFKKVFFFNLWWISSISVTATI